MANATNAAAVEPTTITALSVVLMMVPIQCDQLDHVPTIKAAMPRETTIMSQHYTVHSNTYAHTTIHTDHILTDQRNL